MIRISDLEKIIAKYYKKKVILYYVYDLGSYYVVLALPNDVKPEDISGSYLKIDKATNKVSGFTPALDLENYKKAIKKPIYVKDR